MILKISILMSFLLFLFLNFKKKKGKVNKGGKLLSIKTGLSLILVSSWLMFDSPSFLVKLNWNKASLQEFKLSFIMDQPFILFTSIALFVTWSMVEFSHYYMKKDHNKKAFIKTLIFFLLFMILLVSSKNLFVLFMGWEGVGILSFILISWWFTRSDAKSSALQAIIYKRMGDSGMMMFMAMSITKYKSWNLKEIIFFKSNSLISTWAILGMILAAAGKSAQFSLHPWLPSAMEGPTPVSALLHSSTMVVAGVFILFRCSSILNNFQWALTSMSILGSLTALFAASTALCQFDMKKMIAYSTTSQLGLMTVAMGLKMPKLALFHMCTHAFFKSLLFLCSGKMIHSLKKEQDLRKMGKMAKFLPITTKCLIMGSLALSGIPFLAGFYSKDLMLEASQKNLGKSISVILALMATLMTAIYSTRIMFFLIYPNTSFLPLSPISEETFNSMTPLLRLILGVILGGWLLSIFFFEIEPIMIPWLKKILPFLLTIYATTFVMKKFFLFSTENFNWLSFLGKNWFFVKIFHSNLFKFTLKLSLKGVNRSLDLGWKSYLLSKWLPKTLIQMSNLMQKAHPAIISKYITSFLLLSLALTMMKTLF